MGLRAAVRRLAVGRTHVLLVEAPGGFVARVRTEQACARRGWPVVAAPADADALVVCGDPSADEHGRALLEEAVDAVWAKLPGPRARARVTDPAAAETVLGAVRDDLLAWRAADDPVPPVGDGETDHGDHDMGGMEHSDHDMGDTAGMEHSDHDMGDTAGMEHSDHDMGDMEHGDHDMGGMEHGDHDMGGMEHGDHDMGGMNMGGPAGIPLAEGSDDRDGLEMDETHLRLGPVLAAWPAGLAAWCTLHGDLVTEVVLEATPAADETTPDPEVRRLDALAALLDLAGARRLARRARANRDQRLDLTRSTADDDLRHRLARSRVLAWSLRGLGAVSAATAAERGWPAAWQGDAYDRLLRLADPAPAGPLVTTGQVADALPHLMAGLELGAARLVAAGLVGQAAAPVGALDRRGEVVA